MQFEQNTALNGSYDTWLKTKVEKAIAEADDPNTPRYTTEEVMLRMGRIIKAVEEKEVVPSVLIP